MASSLLTSLGIPNEEAQLYIAKPAGWRLLALALATMWVVGTPTLVKPRWASIVDAFPSRQAAQIWGTVAANVCLQLVFTAAMLPLYLCGLCEQWKVEAKAWPWTSVASAADRARFWQSVRKSVFLVPFNAVGLGYLSLRYTVLPEADRIGALATDVASFPSPLRLFCELGACMLVEDLLFYISHRTMHQSKFLYRCVWVRVACTPGAARALIFYAAKAPHCSIDPQLTPPRLPGITQRRRNVHKWHHEYTTVVCVSSEHAHPVEFVLGNLLPLIVGPMVLKSHLFTVWMWVVLRVFISLEEHCSYAFPFSPVRLLPFGTTPDGHDFHHSHNVGVYASMFIFWDRLCGTDKPFLEHLRKKRLAGATAGAGAGGGDGTGKKLA